MAEIERIGRWDAAQRRPAGGVAPPDVTFGGETVEYDDGHMPPEQAWERLSSGMREWAEQHAGDPIVDPHSRAGMVYWYCSIWRHEASGPRGTPPSATYSLALFGKRGLVVSEGATDAFVDSPDATKWRHRRIALPIDPLAIRHDHHRAAPADSASQATGGRTSAESAPGIAASADAATEVLTDDLAHSDVPAWLGNLPAATQRFLFAPFTGSRSRASHAMVYAYLDWSANELRERYWAYLFNARWMGFAYTVRSVALRGVSRVPPTVASSPDRQTLLRTPWRVSAWVAPVLRDDRSAR